MKICSLLAPAGMAALAMPAAAQESVRLSLSFVEVTAGTNTPVANPDGLIEPGEAARLEVTVLVLPGIGSPVTYVPPPDPGHGTLAGLGSIFMDLVPTGNVGGSWSSIGRAQGWALGPDGTPFPDGSVSGILAGQYLVPGQTANPANPVQAIWHGVWTPSGFTPGAARFRTQPVEGGGANRWGLLIQYGIDAEGNPLYIGKFVPGEMGSVQIPIVPGPGAGWVLGLGLCWARRPRSGMR